MLYAQGLLPAVILAGASGIMWCQGWNMCFGHAKPGLSAFSSSQGCAVIFSVGDIFYFGILI